MKFLKSILFLLVIFIIPVLIVFTFNSSFRFKSDEKNEKQFAIAIHGGAGFMERENISDEQYQTYLDKIDQALQIGIEMLESDGTALDAVESVIRYFEDDSLFNAGKGAVFTHEGKNELDASIMDGKTRHAGAVAAVTRVKNPISASRKVMENSKHVLLAGEGANVFAESQGLEMVDNSYFFTYGRYERLQKMLEEEKNRKKEKRQDKHGTVGCVVLDRHGNLAAGTSTGGRSNKMYGRIGDSPIIGAGTYANNNTCAVSCTGHGEFFIRYAVAYDVSALMEYKGMNVKEAAELVINKKLKEVNGAGGLIAVDKNGNFALPFNTTMMFRGHYKEGEKKVVKMFKEN